MQAINSTKNNDKIMWWTHFSNVNQTKFFAFCNMMKHDNGMLKSNTLKSIIYRIWSTNKNSSKHDVFSIYTQNLEELSLLSKIFILLMIKKIELSKWS